MQQPEEQTEVHEEVLYLPKILRVMEVCGMKEEETKSERVMQHAQMPIAKLVPPRREWQSMQSIFRPDIPMLQCEPTLEQGRRRD